MVNKGKICLTKVFTLDSAHKIIDYNGKCENLHGHTYKLEVSVTGSLDKAGMVIDFSVISNVVKNKIVNKLDHTCLNDIFDFNPTCENVAIWIWNQLEEDFSSKKVEIEKIVLWETPTSYVTLTAK